MVGNQTCLLSLALRLIEKWFVLLNVWAMLIENLFLVKPQWLNQNRVTKILFAYSFLYKVIIKHRKICLYSLRTVLFSNNTVFFLFYRNFLYLDKTSISCYQALFMASKTKTASFRDLMRTMFLVLLLHFWLQKQSSKFLCLDKTFVPCSFAWFMAVKFEMEIFWDLIKTLFLVLLLCLWRQNPKP